VLQNNNDELKKPSQFGTITARIYKIFFGKGGYALAENLTQVSINDI